MILEVARQQTFEYEPSGVRAGQRFAWWRSLRGVSRGWGSQSAAAIASKSMAGPARRQLRRVHRANDNHRGGSCRSQQMPPSGDEHLRTEDLARSSMPQSCTGGDAVTVGTRHCYRARLAERRASLYAGPSGTRSSDTRRIVAAELVVGQIRVRGERRSMSAPGQNVWRRCGPGLRKTLKVHESAAASSASLATRTGYRDRGRDDPSDSKSLTAAHPGERRQHRQAVDRVRRQRGRSPRLECFAGPAPIQVHLSSLPQSDSRLVTAHHLGQQERDLDQRGPPAPRRGEARGTSCKRQPQGLRRPASAASFARRAPRRRPDGLAQARGQYDDHGLLGCLKTARSADESRR